MRARRRLRRPTRVLSLPIAFLLGAILAGGASSATAVPAAAEGVNPTLLRFNCNPPEETCTGNGADDVLIVGCAEMEPPATAPLSGGAPARWIPVSALNQPALDRSQVDPNWIWVLSGMTELEGDMTVRFWASVNEEAVLLGMAWRIQIWADGVQVFTTPAGGIRLPAATPEVPQLFTAVVTLPRVSANSKFVIKVDPEFADTGAGSVIYYDSSAPCPGVSTGQCDSTVTMPVVTPTAVRLESFRSHVDRGGVVLTWRTGSETDVLGFYVWRRAAGAWQKVNRELVAASGQTRGASYRLIDHTARPGKTYRYRLQIVRRDGSKAWYSGARVRVPR